MRLISAFALTLLPAGAAETRGIWRVSTCTQRNGIRQQNRVDFLLA